MIQLVTNDLVDIVHNLYHRLRKYQLNIEYKLFEYYQDLNLVYKLNIQLNHLLMNRYQVDKLYKLLRHMNNDQVRK